MSACISCQLQLVKAIIEITEQETNINPGTVTLVAVSKSQSVTRIKEAIDLGQYHFGESYIQEALSKISAIKDERVVWHFIGRIQSNKTKLIANHFDWVQSERNTKIADRLNEQRPDHKQPLNVCLQVNITESPCKAGIPLYNIEPLARHIVLLPKLRFRGLMIIPPLTDDVELLGNIFKCAKCSFDYLRQEGYPIDTLSMGMTSDYREAILSGSTMVRIGEGLFGWREEALVESLELESIKTTGNNNG
jgi:hypothetical protein